MNVFATRTIQYRKDSGAVKDVVLTVFELVQASDGEWHCAYRIQPPENSRIFTMRGEDGISALLGCLEVARGIVEHPTEDRTSWQGMVHSGLPWRHAKPEGYQAPSLPTPEENPGSLGILTTRRFGIPDGDNNARELVLVVYRPICSADAQWKCAFAFGTAANEPVRYGLGADFIEAFLDALTMARAAYEAMVPSGWEPPHDTEFHTACFMPFKMGREYALEPAKPFPGMPDFFPES